MQRAETGEVLPLTFSYEETLAEANPKAQTVAEFRLEKKSVLLTFKLWNRRMWVLHHLDDFSQTTQRDATRGMNTYKPENEHYFVEYLGDPAHCLWFGDLIENGLLGHIPTERSENSKTSASTYLQRCALAHSLGERKGFFTLRPNILTPSGGFGQWLVLATHRSSQRMVFEPESLYRGVLFASTLATLVLTNGSRLSELLQVSADRFKGHMYEGKKQRRNFALSIARTVGSLQALCSS